MYRIRPLRAALFNIGPAYLFSLTLSWILQRRLKDSLLLDFFSPLSKFWNATRMLPNSLVHKKNPILTGGALQYWTCLLFPLRPSLILKEIKRLSFDEIFLSFVRDYFFAKENQKETLLQLSQKERPFLKVKSKELLLQLSQRSSFVRSTQRRPDPDKFLIFFKPIC